MKTGLDMLLARALAASKKDALGGVVRDLADEGLAVTVEALTAFAVSGARLNSEVLNALAKRWFDASYDPETQMMRRLHKTEATPMGIAPPPLDLDNLPQYQGLKTVRDALPNPSWAHKPPEGFAE